MRAARGPVPGIITLWLVLAFLWSLVGCTAIRPPQTPPRPRPVGAEVLERFRLAPSSAGWQVQARALPETAPQEGPEVAPPAVGTVDGTTTDGTDTLEPPRPVVTRWATATDDTSIRAGAPPTVALPRPPMPVFADIVGPRAASAWNLDDEDEPEAPEVPPIRLEDVLLSVETHFPVVLATLEEIEIAAGKELAAQGAFDTKLGAKGLFETEGFYESDRIDVGVTQPTTLWGTTFEAGYRRGTGDFAVYDGKAKTNKRGELRAGATVPLLQGGAIDPARVALWQARLAQEAAEPKVVEKRLDATLKAAETYWKWVALGAKRRIFADLLDLAELRQDQVEVAVEEGQLAPIDLVDNERLIVDRTSKLVAVDRALQQAAITLSLFLRDAEGEPLIASMDAVPPDFPEPRTLGEVLVPDDETLALEQRPELRRIEIDLEKLRLDRDLADNQLLPGLDVGVFGSQDYGSAANDPDDKGDFELEARVRFELPIQRRKPRGTLQAADGRIAQTEQELRYQRDLVLAEVRDTVTAISQTLEQVDQARRNVDLARRLEEAERLQLREGESDLFRVNVREQQSAVAASGLVDVLKEYFLALAGYRAALGLPYDEVVAGQPVGGAP